MAEPPVPERLIEKYREAEVYHDWWGFLYEQFVQEMGDVGIEIAMNHSRPVRGASRVTPEIYFTLHVQGAGVEFRGHVGNWPVFLATHDLYGKWPTFEKYLETEEGDARFQFSVHGGDLSYTGFEFDDRPEVPECMALQLSTWLEEDAAKVEPALTDIFRGHAHDLYTRLDDEYDYLTSDEVVIEYIRDQCEDELAEALAEDGEDALALAA
jgi:hypothetical protein